MARLNAANNTSTVLSGAISAAATSLIVSDASKFPAVPFVISIDDEIILVGAKAGTTFSSLTRAYEGTTAASHANLAAVEHRWTAGMYEALLSEDGELTINDTTVPTGNTMSVLNLFKGLATMIKAITGKANWRTAPAKSLEDLNAHLADNVKHAGAWAAWTPTLTWTTATPTVTATVARSIQIGKTIFWTIKITGSDGKGATNLTISLPIAPKANNTLPTGVVSKFIGASFGAFDTWW
ncbi:MAG: hypothetical protein WC147_12560, partial [Syntrophomonas sp.]